MKNFRDRLGRDLEHLESEIVQLGAYEVEQINDLKELNGVGLVIRHTKTWARFSVVLNDDESAYNRFNMYGTLKETDIPIMEDKILCADKNGTQEFYKALIHIYKKEAFDTIYDAYNSDRDLTGMEDKILSIYKKAHIAGALTELNEFLHNEHLSLKISLFIIRDFASLFGSSSSASSI